MINPERWFDRMFDVPARGLAALGCTPNMATIGGLTFGCASCAVYVVTRNLPLFTVLLVASGLVDSLDGAIARKTGQSTRFGAYLDALCDRYFDGAVLLTVAHVSGHWVPAGILLAGTLAIPYAKARAAMEVKISNQGWPDLMERLERSLIFLAGLVLWGVWPVLVLGHDLLWWTLILLSALCHLTVFQRALRARTLMGEA